MIGSMHDLGNCTDLAELKEQKDRYQAEIAGYCRVNPLCAAIIMKMGTDENFLDFISLANRINELEGKTND